MDDFRHRARRYINSASAAAIVVCLVSFVQARAVPAQAAATARATALRRARFTDAELASATARIRRLMPLVRREIGVANVILSVQRGYAHLTFENWKRTPLTRTALEPFARRAGALLRRADSGARAADSVIVTFVDYTPKVASLTWRRADFQRRPERYRFEVR